MLGEVEAFLIHRRDYQNNSELLDFLTNEFGLVRSIARGIKSKKAKIQAFSKLNITLSGVSNLKKLQNWQIEDEFREISYDNLLLLTYVNEILTKLLTDNPIQICDEYYYLLTHLNNDKVNNHWLLRIFENHLLSELGFGLEFEFDIENKKVQNDKNYNFILNQGFKESEIGIRGEDILKFAKDRMPSAKGLSEYKKINRSRIDFLLGGREIKTRSLFK
jgi:DNA repair protein RecO (recombination protein O)